MNDLTENLGTETRLENYVRRGARYIYTNDSTLLQIPEVNKHFKEIKTTGSFIVLKLL